MGYATCPFADSEIHVPIAVFIKLEALARERFPATWRIALNCMAAGWTLCQSVLTSVSADAAAQSVASDQTQIEPTAVTSGTAKHHR